MKSSPRSENGAATSAISKKSIADPKLPKSRYPELLLLITYAMYFATNWLRHLRFSYLCQIVIVRATEGSQIANWYAQIKCHQLLHICDRRCHLWHHWGCAHIAMCSLYCAVELRLQTQSYIVFTVRANFFVTTVNYMVCRPIFLLLKLNS